MISVSAARSTTAWFSRTPFIVLNRLFFGASLPLVLCVAAIWTCGCGRVVVFGGSADGSLDVFIESGHDDASVESGSDADATSDVNARQYPTPINLCPTSLLLPPIVAEPTVVSIVTDYLHECVVLRDGTARCIGSNLLGQLGSGGFEPRSLTPQPIAGLRDVRQIDFGQPGSNVSLQGDGTIRTWGGEDLLGTPAPALCGPRGCAVAPVMVPGLDGVIAIAMSGGSACVLRTDRTAWCWGMAPGIFPQSSPVPVLADLRGDVLDLITLSDAILLRRTDGTLVGTALESVGASISPTWEIVPGDAGHICAVLPDRTMRCWGRSGSGQLGIGPLADLVIGHPADPGIDCIRNASRALSHTCALRTDGTVWCWGGNGYSQAGAPAEENQECPDNSGRHCILRPRRVDGIDHVEAISTGPGRSCAIRADRSVWCWGRFPVDPSLPGSFRPVRNDWQ